ncbi:PepSY domain-containing protein [Trichothermofontia sp.]
MPPNLRHPNFRKVHRKIAPVIFLPLCLTALTGIVYRLGSSWFGVPAGLANQFMAIHQGKFLGQPLAPFYVLLSGMGLLVMIGTGITMVPWQRLGQLRSSNRPWPWVHRTLAVIACLPLSMSALTGIGYGLGRAWFNLPGRQAGWLLQLHQGAYLGPVGRSFYVLLVGLGLLGLLLSGIHLSGILRRRP